MQFKYQNGFISSNLVRDKYAFNLSKQFNFKQSSLNIKTLSFQTTQFSSILPIDRTLPGATTPGQSGPESDGNER